jgi:hypothetical protein
MIEIGLILASQPDFANTANTSQRIAHNFMIASNTVFLPTSQETVLFANSLCEQMQSKLARFWISPVLGILSLNIFFAGAGNAATFPPKPNQKQPWEFDIDKYHWRHLVENCFAQMQKYRGIATLYDQRACAFLGGVHWVASVIRLNC